MIFFNLRKVTDFLNKKRWIYDPTRGIPISSRNPEQADWKTLGLGRPAPAGIKPDLWKKMDSSAREAWLDAHTNGVDDIDPATNKKYQVPTSI